MDNSPLLQSPFEFLEDFKERIKHAQERVWLQAMVIESGEVLDSVAPLLIDAAKRGVDVRLYYDWVTQRYLHGHIRLTPTLNSTLVQQEQKQHMRNAKLWDKLRKRGVKVVEVNRPIFGRHAFPVMGRNHIKIYVVDNATWMGGINFFDSSFNNLDFMVRFTDQAVVGALCAQFMMVNAERPKKDYVKRTGEWGVLVVDAGKQGKSLIYDQAYDMVEKANDEVIFVSQLVPENSILELLLEKAKKGVRVIIYTSHPEDSTFTKYPLRYFYTTFRKELKKASGSITFIHLNKKIHAKLIVVDGKEAMFGSHNFVESGVQMGTQEISLRTQNPELLRQLLEFVISLKAYIPTR
jgi:cardiolipin synthase A/B